MMTKEEFINKYNIYTGKKLYMYVGENLKDIKYRRLIIKDIIKDFNSERNRKRLISITGDRRRGKSTTMLQIIQLLLYNNIKSEDIIFFNGKYKDDLYEIGKNLINLRYIENYNPKYILIDEITDMENLEIGIKMLSDEVKYYGNNIIVTGTWSQIFHELKLGTLLDRVLIYELEQITFNDNKKYLNKDIYESIRNGMYIQDIKNDITFQDSIDNMTNFLRLSTRYKNLSFELSDNDIKFFYFSLLFLGKQLSSKNIKSYSTLYNKYNYINELYDNIDNKNEINGENNIIRLNKRKIIDLIQILLLTRQTIFVNNIASCDNKDIIDKYTIIPKNITIRSFINEYDNNIDKNKIYQSIFEDYITVITSYKDNNIKLRYNENKEIDIIDTVNSMLIEVKMTDKWKSNYNKNLLDNELLKEFNLDKFSKNCVYLGDTRILNNGIKLWNIYDFEREVLKEEYLLEYNPYYLNNKLESNIILNWD